MTGPAQDSPTLSSDMKRLVTEQRLGFVATVCPDGTPSLSPKGTTAVWDDEHLVFADIRSPGTVSNLLASPAVEVNVVDPIARKGYRFKGEATVLTNGALFDRVLAFYELGPAPVQRARSRIRSLVLVKVQRALPLDSPVYDLGATEEAVRAHWWSRHAQLASRPPLRPPPAPPTGEAAGIRRISGSDYEAIIRVIDDWWGGRPMAAMLPRAFVEHFADTSFAAEAGGRLAGFLVGFCSPSRPGEAYIHFVGVHPNERRQGLARRLYETFFQSAEGRGCTVVRAITAPVNSPSVAFHRRMGFDIEPGDAERNAVPFTADYDGPGQDRVRFIKRLPAMRGLP